MPQRNTKKSKKAKSVPKVAKRPKISKVSQKAEATKATGLKQRVSAMLHSPQLDRLFAGFALLILLASTVFWATLGAITNRGNADQLSDSYLFENSHTFHNAIFPGAHTFILKWPLFLLTKLMGFSTTSFDVLTVTSALLTVGAFAFLLYRIARRPLLVGTIYLALASVLLLVPAQPYPGGILPVNMAMLTTRNVEYIFFIFAMVLVMRARQWKSLSLWLAVVVLGLLAASDKLFIDMSLGGALLTALVYGVRRNRAMVRLALKWFMVSVLAFALAAGLLWAVNAYDIAKVSSQSGLGPFGYVHNGKKIMLGIVYAGFGLLTDFGANPAANVSLLRQVPAEAVRGLANVGALTYLANLVIFLGGLYCGVRIAAKQLTKPKAEGQPLARAEGLSIMLGAATLTSLAMFVASDHYYPVDARYLAIAVFAFFVAIASYMRSRPLRRRSLMAAGLVLLLAVVCGLVPAWRSYNADKSALSTLNHRNQQIVDILYQYHVGALVGDYWRVVPTRLASKDHLKVVPLSGCAQPTGVLSSQAWQGSLKHKFAYLLTFDKSLTGYPKCSFEQVVAKYGLPSSSMVIAGKLNAPKEMLLFYDPAHQKLASKAAKTLNSSLPVLTDQLKHRTCDTSTVINIVAHQDDDLLFMNPDLLHALRDGKCVRTIYVTAGDNGSGKYYWVGREKGAEAAYAEMLGVDNVWTQRSIQMPNGQYVTVACLNGNKKASLLFMRLPDGNLNGHGFKSNHNGSIGRLWSGTLATAKTVDDQSEYSLDDLTTALSTLINIYGPAEIRTQSSIASNAALDHSDHRAVSHLVTSVFNQFYGDAPDFTLHYYLGYPTRTMMQNVSDQDLEDKINAFLAYAKFDGGVCNTKAECSVATNNYSAYLRRQYPAER